MVVRALALALAAGVFAFACGRWLASLVAGRRQFAVCCRLPALRSQQLLQPATSTYRSDAMREQWARKVQSAMCNVQGAIDRAMQCDSVGLRCSSPSSRGATRDGEP